MGQGQGYTNHDDFQVLSFTAVLTQSKGYLLDGIDRKCTFQNQT